MDLVKFTALDGSALYINPESVNAIRLIVPGESEGKSAIIIEGVTFYVREAVEDAVYRLR